MGCPPYLWQHGIYQAPFVECHLSGLVGICYWVGNRASTFALSHLCARPHVVCLSTAPRPRPAPVPSLSKAQGSGLPPLANQSPTTSRPHANYVPTTCFTQCFIAPKAGIGPRNEPRGRPQYCANVALKVNAKLDGVNASFVSPNAAKPNDLVSAGSFVGVLPRVMGVWRLGRKNQATEQDGTQQERTPFFLAALRKPLLCT